MMNISINIKKLDNHLPCILIDLKTSTYDVGSPSPALVYAKNMTGFVPFLLVIVLSFFNLRLLITTLIYFS
jgi:hypothetical protein